MSLFSIEERGKNETKVNILAERKGKGTVKGWLAQILLIPFGKETTELFSRYLVLNEIDISKRRSYVQSSS